MQQHYKINICIGGKFLNDKISNTPTSAAVCKLACGMLRAAPGTSVDVERYDWLRKRGKQTAAFYWRLAVQIQTPCHRFRQCGTRALLATVILYSRGDDLERRWGPNSSA
ncbi:hypothetical protein V5799_014125 [Amblyomma americanum]|uniref:Uncharacterized protein n=1 Tax=Amblyomma americanum TaxID=6943 RepID=A0AAQ4E3Y7_AMBAM